MTLENRNRVLVVLFFGVLMAALDIAILAPALPAIQQAFAVDARNLQWVFSIYVLMNLIGTPLMAHLSDRFGRRNIYVLDLGLFAIGSLLIVVAPGFSIVLLGRAIQGLGAGGIFPVAAAVIGDTFPPEKRGSALGLIGAVFGLAFIVGPILGSILLRWGWHYVFILNVPIALALMIAAWVTLPSTRLEKPHGFDWLGMGTLALALASLASALSQLDPQNFSESFSSLQVWPLLLLALVLFPVFWLIEQRADDPIIRPRILASRQVKLAAAISFGAGLGETSVLFLPALAVAAFALTPSAAGFWLTPLLLALLFGSPTAGRMLDRVGSRTVVMSGTLLLAVGLLVLALWGEQPWAFFTGSILLGLGLSALLGAPLRYILLNEAQAVDRAAAQAVGATFTSVGQLVGAAAVGGIVASFGGGIAGYSAGYLTIGLIALVLAGLSLMLKNRADEQAAAAANQ
jgi:EmrB/QacA subfamily drug resistance transporter